MIALYILTILFILTAPTFGQDNAVYPTLVTRAIYFDIYGPIKFLPPITEEEFQLMEKDAAKERNEELAFRTYPYKNIALPKGEDAVWQKKMGETTIINLPLLDLEGQSSPYYPPDCNGDVGPNHYFQAVNTTYSIYDKTGTQLVAPTAFNTLFAGVTGSTNNDGDPIILYDEQADRWLAAEFSISGANDYMLIAVSQTGDPTGLWYRWSFDVDDMPDYEKFGIWRDGYYMATNTASGSDVYVFQRDIMLSGGTNPLAIGFDNPWRPSTIDGFHSIQPLDNDGTFAPTNSPGLFITINDDAIAGGNDQLWIYELSANWATPLNSTFVRVQQLDVSPFDSDFGNSWENIRQAGTTKKLDAIPMVLMYRAQYRNFGNTQNIVCNHTVDVDGTDHAGIRWYELQKTTANWSIRQQGTYAPDEHSRWMGSIAMNSSHEIALGYSISSTSIYPGIRYSGQTAGENASATGNLDIAEVILLTGSNAQTASERWGDYSSISVDPSDERTFWFTTEYIGTGGTRNSRITSFKFEFEQFSDLTSIDLMGLNYSDAAWGDYDNDGDLDILLTGSYDYWNQVSKIYRNNNDNTFTEITSISLANVFQSSTDWGDYDNDGDLDILLTGNTATPSSANPISKIYRNNGDNTFSEMSSISLLGVYDGSADWGDYDNDGDLDILLTGSTSDLFTIPLSTIYRNNGDGTFTNMVSITLTNVGRSSAEWGDYDNDGDLDILLTGNEDPPAVTSKIYRNNPNHTFTEMTSISLIGVMVGSVAWGDYDSDGDLDILLTGWYQIDAATTKIYRNDGNDNFTDLTSISLPGVYQSSAVWADYDNDGDLDILMTGYQYPITATRFIIARNNGNDTFTDITPVSLTGVGIGAVALGDYDNDSDLDILVTGNAIGNQRISKIYRNNTITNNTPPTEPANLTANVTDQAVTFSWSKSTDNQTPQNGLTYNLVVGTTPGENDIFSPMADRTMGFRKVVQIGNTNQNNNWTIEDLTYSTTYYWSVQALDNNFTGSEFSSEQEVTVPLPVELTSFTAIITENYVIDLWWETATEVNNYGFEIERSVKNIWEMIGFVEGHGNSNSPKEYSYLDKNPFGGSKFKYRLKQIDTDGKFEYSEEIEVEIIPTEFALYQNYPNPFNPSTKIRYQLPQESVIILKVYDILGAEVITLLNEKKEPGVYEVVFNAQSAPGGLTSGIYIYRIQAYDPSASSGQSYVKTKKMILLK